MTKLQYQCAMSLDGYIAGPGGDMAWLTDYFGQEDPMGEAIMVRTGALLNGRRTFGGGDPLAGTEHEGEPYGGGWDGPQFVLTHNPPDFEVPGITFVGDLDTAVAAAKDAAGGKNVGILGANVAAQCIDAGLLDEVFVKIVPAMLGGGVRLFDRPDGAAVKLERIASGETPELTNLLLRVVR